LFELPEASRVESTPELLTLHVELELSAIVRGLRASVLRDLSDILRLPARKLDTQNPNTP